MTVASTITPATITTTARRYHLDPGAGLLSPAERAARGKAARAAVPRASHAVFDPPADRIDPLTLLQEQAESRLPELVSVRYGRMSMSPLAYYRGAALPMARDLTATPVSGLTVQVCGDAHLSNFSARASIRRSPRPEPATALRLWPSSPGRRTATRGSWPILH